MKFKEKLLCAAMVVFVLLFIMSWLLPSQGVMYASMAVLAAAAIAYMVLSLVYYLKADGDDIKYAKTTLILSVAASCVAILLAVFTFCGMIFNVPTPELPEGDEAMLGFFTNGIF